MDKMIDINRIKLEQLKDYYSDKNLTIIGLNDGERVNKRRTAKYLVLDYLSGLIKREAKETIIIDLLSTTFNKTEHINYFLESNLSVDEIKHLEFDGQVSNLETKMEKHHLPKFLGKAGNIGKLFWWEDPEDEQIFLTDTIKDSSELVVVYSCGRKDLKEGRSIGEVISNVETNISNLLSLNNNANIYVLGLNNYDLTNSILVHKYNSEILKLCRKYNIKYIDTTKELTNFELAQNMAEDLYVRKIKLNGKFNRDSIQPEMKVYNNKTLDILVSLKRDLKRLQQELTVLSDEEDREQCLEKISEVERQKKVVEKIARKRL